MTALALNGKAGRTQEAYSRALRVLRQPGAQDIGEAELEAYFLHRRNVDHWSANTLRAISESRLPAVLSCEQVRALLGGVRTPHNRAYLSSVYARGLRLQEALYLEVSDIDADRMMIHVHRYKGAKDRFVPLSKKRGVARKERSAFRGHHFITHRILHHPGHKPNP